ncbi:ribonuclease H-like domain-containing protein [Aspergillus egyptiacus]|nr:ribonuclease H-like domain-containing protein [Aspergillus egyptiacus]
MSSAGGPPQRGGGRGRASDHGRGQGAGRGDRGGRGRGGNDRGRGSHMNLAYRPGPGDSGRGGSFRGRGGRGGGRGGGQFQGPPVYAPPGGVPKPDPKVTQKENDFATALVKKAKFPGIPERPGYGTRGKEVTLFANYFELKSVGKALNRYDIRIEGGHRAPGAKKARQIVRLLLEEHFPNLRHSIVTDYRSNMISHQMILSQHDVPVTFNVRYRGEYDDEYPEAPEVYQVICDFTGHLEPGDLLNFLTSSNASAMFESKASMLQALNIALGHHAKSATDIASVGANRHYGINNPLAEKFNLGSGLEALRGYFVSVRAATARLLVNVQVKYVACYEVGPLDQVFRAFRERNAGLDKQRKFVSKLKVRAIHIPKKNKRGQDIPRMKTIIDFANPSDGKSLDHPPIVPRIGAGPEEVKFYRDSSGQQGQQTAPREPKGKKGKKPAKAGPESSGEYISVAKFFKERYPNVQIDTMLPVVNVGTRERPSYLPMQACIVEPGQPAKTKLTSDQTRQMLWFAIRRPAQNAQSIVTKGMKTLGLPSNPTLDDFGIQTNPGLITVPGRVLAPPNVFYKDTKSNQKQIAPMSGSWNMKSIRFSTSSKLTNWTWIWLGETVNTRDGDVTRWHFDDSHFKDCLNQFSKKLNEVGVITQAPKHGTKLSFKKDGAYEKAIPAAIKGLMDKYNPQLILTFLPSNDSDIYNCIKQACDLHYGVRNVSVSSQQFAKRSEQYYANVGLKFNLKLGGINQIVRPKDLGIISEGKTMLVGIDVTHPSPGSADNAPSVAGMVASIDSSLGQWPAEIRVQSQSRKEMVDDLESMLKAHLARWEKSHNGAYPENIIIYRDGVSEGQYDMVTKDELPLLKKACAATYPATQTAKNLPRISIIIVGKRHHTRFYPTSEADADRSQNPENGTVVDRGVTEARNWDFYLQAHTALQGTARPAHYYTVWDEIFLNIKPGPSQNTADMLEAMTHSMCYLFGRATKAVSICPPAYYADLVCTRARTYLSRAFDPNTPSGSVISGGGQGVIYSSKDVGIHRNVKDTMFYI